MIRTLLSLLALFIGVTGFQSEARADQKEWTFLIFLNGNNNLDSYGEMNMNQMEKIGSTDQVNVVVQWASLANRKVQRHYMTKDYDTKKVTSPVVSTPKNKDMGDYQALIEFVNWGVQNYPAKHYFINVWDHGSGWHFTKTGVTKDISWDDVTGSYMTTEQLALAIQESAKIIGHKVDIYGSDACLMGMVEIAHEMKDAVDVFIGSEETEPADGWPYDTLLRDWNKLSDIGNPRAVASTLTDVYEDYYQIRNQSVTLSAFDLNFIDPLNQALRKFSDSFRGLKPADLRKIAKAAKESTRFTNDDYVDLGDFINHVKELKLPRLKDVNINDISATAKDFVISNRTIGFPKAEGAAIWIPTDTYTYERYADRYSRLNFDQATHWSDVAKEIANAAK
jgi:hypothetical protein